MATSKRWRDMSRRQRRSLVGLTAVELGLTAAAVLDLYRRPSAQIRGPKPLWWLGVFVQPVGPIAYLTWARRRAPVEA